jgi:co-chaperonin GroES (HSP10)
MEEEALINAENMTQDDVLEVILDFPLEPIRNKILITINTEQDESDDGVVIKSNHMSETQYVIASGPGAKDLVPGQKILLDLNKLTQYTTVDDNTHEKIGTIQLRTVPVNGKMYALINDVVVDCKDAR